MLGDNSTRMADTQITEQRLLLLMGVILLTLLHPAAGKLQIGRVDSPIEILRGHNTTLPCLFYGYETSPLDLSIVSVRWTLRTSEGDKQVYWFHAGDHIQTRPGSYIPDSGLMGGDGSLYISNIQPSDDGEYTCTVFVTPEKAIRKVTMEVSAVPTCTVSYPILEMTPDTERSVTCYVSGFYPQPVTIFWVKYSKASSNKSILDDRTYTSTPVRNRDGTYYMKTVLPMRPISTDEDGDVYSCVITHRSLRDDALTCNVTISVQPIAGNKAALISGIVSGILVTLLLVLFLIYRRYIEKAPPEIMDFTASDLIHRKKTTLTCDIVYFRPRDIEINLYIKKGDEETHVQSWPTRTGRNEYLLSHDSLGLRLGISSSRNGVSSCVCYIHITPNIQEHDGAKLILEVHHEALKSPIRKELRLRVTAPPEVMDITAPDLIHRKKTTLTCDIVNYKSRDIEINLYIKKVDEETLVQSWPTRTGSNKYPVLHDSLVLNPNISSINGVFSCTCSIDIRPDIQEHDGAKLILEVHHEALKSPIRKEVTLRVTAPPEIMDITGPELIHGRMTTLTCHIVNFSPRDIDINLYLKKSNETLVQSWSTRTKNDEEIPVLDHPLMLDPVIASPINGVFSCICSIHITPLCFAHDGAKLILEVHHEALTSPIRKDVTLRVTVSRNVSKKLLPTCEVPSIGQRSITL